MLENEKIERKEDANIKKKTFNIRKLFLFVYLNYVNYFFYNIKLNSFKVDKILIYFKYI